MNSLLVRGHCHSFQVRRSCSLDMPSSSTSSIVGSGARGAPGMGSAPAAISAANSASSIAAGQTCRRRIAGAGTGRRGSEGGIDRGSLGC